MITIMTMLLLFLRVKYPCPLIFKICPFHSRYIDDVDYDDDDDDDGDDNDNDDDDVGW